MITHAPTFRSQSQSSLPNQPFFSWLRTHTTLFIGQIIGLLGGISVPIALFYYSHAIPTDVEWQTVGDFVVYAHLLFLVVFIAFLVRGLDKNTTGTYRAKLVHQKLQGDPANHAGLELFSTRQVGRFKRHFLRFWCAMLCLYSVFAIQSIFAVAPDDSLKVLQLKEMFRTEFFPILSFVLNNLSLVFVFCCFSILYIPIDVTPGELATPDSTSDKADTIPKPEVKSRTGPWPLFSRLMTRIVKKCSRPDLDQLKFRQRTLVWSFIVLIVGLTITFPLVMITKWGVPTNWSEYPAVFDALSGTINAIALALLVAKLDSKLIGLPSWLICVLYFYAGVQPMFVVFELHPEVYAGIKTAVLLVVFVFKIYFFLIIYYTLQTGRMFNYFFCSRVLIEHVKKLKEPLPFVSAPKTQTTETLTEKKSEAPIDVRPVEEVPPDPASTTVPKHGWSKWLKKIFWTKPQVAAEIPLEGAAEVETSEPLSDGAPKQAPEESAQGQPVPVVKQDWRAVWFERLGVAAIIIFPGSLLTYVSLPEDWKLWIDLLDLSDFVIILQVILLIVICIWVFVAWYVEPKRGSRQREKARSKVRAKLLFQLADPGSPKARRGKYKDLSKQTRRQFKRFTLYFRLFWLSLLSLYLVMGLSGFFVPDVPAQPIPQEVAHITEGKADLVDESEAGAKVNAFSWSFPEIKSGLSGENQTTAKGIHKSEATGGHNSEPPVSSQVAEPRVSVAELPGDVIFSFTFFVINNFTVLMLFWCFAVLYIPADDPKFEEKRRVLRNYSLLIFILLTVLIPLLAMIIRSHGFTLSEVGKMPTILGAVGGTLNAVAFALLIARLDSRIIGLPLQLVTVLYAYAALQPLFVTFNQPSKLLKFIATSAMIAVFLFKICLVLMVGYVRRSGALVDYLWFFPVLNKSVNSIFDNQFEIKAFNPKPHSFTFSIFHKDVKTYKATKTYTDQDQCDDAIKTLAKAMESRENYSNPAREVQGTHWVQVKSGDTAICESVGLRSQNEADELINESIEKVPYCKYDRG